jgi:hypothetical protein
MDAIAALCEVIPALCEALGALCELIPALVELLCQAAELFLAAINAIFDMAGFKREVKAGVMALVVLVGTAFAGHAVIARSSSGSAKSQVVVQAEKPASRTAAGEPAPSGVRKLKSVFRKVKKWGNLTGRASL